MHASTFYVVVVVVVLVFVVVNRSCHFCLHYAYGTSQLLSNILTNRHLFSD